MTPAPHTRPSPIDFNVRRIGVFRALVLGDLLCATPALRALKQRWPESELTLISLPWAREFAARLPTVDRFIEFPGHPALPERVADLASLPAFIDHMRAEPFDLLLQLHGSGSIVNPLLATFGARHLAGFTDASGYCAEPSLHVAWPEQGHEIERMLRLTDHLGLKRQGLQLDFPVAPEDLLSLRAKVPELDLAQPFVCVHAGAQLPSRQWMPERFAQVADQLAALGHRVVLTGTAAEAPLVAQVRQHMAEPALDLSGRTTLFELGALIQNAALLVANDTGVSHIAAALRTPSVVVSSGADVARWAPLDAKRHQVLWADAPCRPCGHRVCPYQHECAAAVTVDQVSALARQRLSTLAEDAS